MIDRDPPSLGPRRRRQDRATFVAILGVVLVLGLWLWSVGLAAFVGALGRLSALELAVLAVVGLCPVAIWGLALRAVFHAIGIEASTVRAIGYFLASVFLNGVTPFGQLGGDPPSGLLIARTSTTAFEDALAAVGSVNAINRVAVVVLGVVAWAILAGQPAVGDALAWAVGLAVLLVVGLGALAVLAWRHREPLTAVTGRVLGGVAGAIGAHLPVGPTPTRASVTERVDGFVAALGRLGGSRPLLAATLLLGALGHLAAAGLLWLAAVSVGAGVSPLTLVAVLPLSKLSGLAPLPGGAGTAPVLLGGLLVAVAGLNGPTAAAAALVYRAVAIWIPTAVGGVATAALLVRRG
jgi:uncharacterized protein (TIRG00374 family)